MTRAGPTYRPRTASYAARRALGSLPSPWTTLGLLVVNVLVFLAMALGPLVDGDRLLVWGALYGPATHDQPWRLISAGFLHGGLLHLALNMMVLWDLGSVLERVGGARRFLCVYLVALLGASLTSWAWSPLTVSVGASGAILGLAGDLFVNARALLRDDAAAASLRRSIGQWLALLVALGFVLPVDNAAHLGGFATGALIGWTVAPTRTAVRRPAFGRALGAAGGLVLFTALFAVGRARVEAGPQASARVHHLRGLRLLDADRAQEAAAEFARALERSLEPGFLRHRALARFQAGDREGFWADLAAASGLPGGRTWVPREAEALSEIAHLGLALERVR